MYFQAHSTRCFGLWFRISAVFSICVRWISSVVRANRRIMEAEQVIPSGWVEGWKKVLTPMRRYHSHQVHGLDCIPKEGPALLVIHHSLATYDGLLFALAMHEHTGRMPVALGDDMIFRTPGLKDLAWKTGIRPASPKAGYDLLKEGRLLFVSPGGMWESLRSSEEARTVRWENRKGFCRLALRAQVPIVPQAARRFGRVLRAGEGGLVRPG